MQDRRQYRRRSLALSLDISNRTRRNLGRGFITNLSAGGVALETPKVLHPGELLLLRFSLPGNRELELAGEVVYARDGVFGRAYGARFSRVGQEAGTRLQAFVEQRPDRH